MERRDHGVRAENNPSVGNAGSGPAAGVCRSITTLPDNSTLGTRLTMTPLTSSYSRQRELVRSHCPCFLEQRIEHIPAGMTR